MPNGAMIIKTGGIGSLIWLVGIILSAVAGLNFAILAAGGIVMGIGILILGLAGIGFWQRDMTALSIFTGIFGIIAGVVLLAGGAALSAAVLIVYQVGAILTGIFLVLLALILLRERDRLNTEAQLGIDLAFPAALTVLIGGCTFLGLAVVPAAPAAVLSAIVLFLAR